MSQRVRDADNSHRKYLALAMLELEKARHTLEKRTANQRVANIDQRVKEIAAEQADLLAVAQADLDALATADPSGPPAASSSQSESGFTLAY